MAPEADLEAGTWVEIEDECPRQQTQESSEHRDSMVAAWRCPEYIDAAAMAAQTLTYRRSKLRGRKESLLQSFIHGRMELAPEWM